MKPEFEDDIGNARFDDLLCERTDAIYDAVHALLEAVTGKKQPHDMYYLGELADIAEAHWGNMGFYTCFPGYVGEEETPCYLAGDCDNPGCPMKKHS